MSKMGAYILEVSELHAKGYSLEEAARALGCSTEFIKPVYPKSYEDYLDDFSAGKAESEAFAEYEAYEKALSNGGDFKLVS